MSKKNKKQDMQYWAEEVKKGMLRELNRCYQQPLTNEARESLEDDKIRAEVFYRVQEWMQNDVKALLDELTGETMDQIGKLKKLIKATEKDFDKYQVEIKWLKQCVKDLEKKVSELEKHDKHEKQILTRLAVGGGMVSAGASFKEVRKGYKKYATKGNYVRTSNRRYQLEDKNIIDM